MTQHPATPQQAAHEWQPSNPPAPPPPEKEKSWFARHKVLTAILVLFVFFVLAQAFGGDGDGDGQADAPAETTAAAFADDASAPEASAETPVEEETTEETPAEEPAAPELPGIGDAVRDGKFEFVVTGVEDGGTEVGSEFLSEQAQGRFHLIHLTVTNIGDEAQMMSDSNQKVKDDQGRTFEASTTAGIYLEDNDMWLKDINPGNTLSGTLVFDMPEGSTPVEIVLHDSMFSGGVTVSLR